jgi:hypothetical protein
MNKKDYVEVSPIIVIITTLAIISILLYSSTQSTKQKEEMCGQYHKMECEQCHDRGFAFHACAGYCAESDNVSIENSCEFDLDKSCDEVTNLGCLTSQGVGPDQVRQVEAYQQQRDYEVFFTE